MAPGCYRQRGSSCPSDSEAGQQEITSRSSAELQGDMQGDKGHGQTIFWSISLGCDWTGTYNRHVYTESCLPGCKTGSGWLWNWTLG